MKKTIAIALLAAASTAHAQYGRLVPPAKVFDLHRTACRASAPNFAARLPVLAKSLKWDEYGVTAKARPGDRAWLVAIGGMPTIVDISRKGAVQRCSVNAVTDPSAILSMTTKEQGRKPDSSFSQGPNGTVSVWHIDGVRTLSVTTPVGQALSRITIEASR